MTTANFVLALLLLIAVLRLLWERHDRQILQRRFDWWRGEALAALEARDAREIELTHIRLQLAAARRALDAVEAAARPLPQTVAVDARPPHQVVRVARYGRIHICNN